MYDSLTALEGCLPCVWRGVPLHMIDSSSEPGRRLIETYFPGVDGAAYDDYGRAAEQISINAVHVGDDYRVIAAALRTAAARPGPGLLVHPWLGPLNVLAVDPPQISFAANELRVVRFSATFKVASNASRSSIGNLLGSAASAFGTAAGALVLAVGTLVLSSVRTRAVSRSSRRLVAAVTAATRAAGQAQAGPIRTVAATAVTVPADYAGVLTALHATLAAVTLTPAVSPAAGYVPPKNLSSADRMEIGLRIASTVTAEAGSAPSPADRALLIASAAQSLRAACEQSAYIDFGSRRDAISTRQRLTSGIEALVTAIEPLSSSLIAGPASDLSRTARDLQAAVSCDINEVIGRLPDVLTFSPGRPANAWLVAMHLFGDRPQSIEEAYADIVARNRPRHPAQMDGRLIEALDR